MYELIPDLVGKFDPRYPERTMYSTVCCKSDTNGNIYTYGTVGGMMSGVSGMFKLGTSYNNVELTGPSSFFLDDSFPNDKAAFWVHVREKFLDVQIGWDHLNNKVMKMTNIPTGWSLGYAEPFSISFTLSTLHDLFPEGVSTQYLMVVGPNGQNKTIQLSLDNNASPYVMKVERVNIPGGNPGNVYMGWDLNRFIMGEITRRSSQAELETYKASTNVEIRELQKKVNSLTSIDSSMFISR